MYQQVLLLRKPQISSHSAVTVTSNPHLNTITSSLHSAVTSFRTVSTRQLTCNRIFKMSHSKGFYYNNSDKEGLESFTESDIIEAVTSHVSEQLCFGSRAIREMTIRDIQNTPIYLYTLRLSVEERSSISMSEPYRGEPLDMSQMQVPGSEPVDIWSIGVPQPCRFPDGNFVVDIPGSIQIHNCAKCSAAGSVQCEKCSGTALVSCGFCFGSGALDDPNDPERKHHCPGCRGQGRAGCTACETRGILPCKSCLGFRRVKLWNKLEVKWRSNYVKSTRRTGNISIKVGMLSGLVRTFVAEDSGSRACADVSIFQTFQPVLEQELERFATLPRHRVVDIHQRIYSFPAVEAVYQLKDAQESFLVYGQEKRVRFASNSPLRGCGKLRCSIL